MNVVCINGKHKSIKKMTNARFSSAMNSLMSATLDKDSHMLIKHFCIVETLEMSANEPNLVLGCVTWLSVLDLISDTILLPD